MRAVLGQSAVANVGSTGLQFVDCHFLGLDPFSGKPKKR